MGTEGVIMAAQEQTISSNCACKDAFKRKMFTS